MPSKIPDAHHQLGTFIDDNALELVEVLGVGGYGVVYRAVETCCMNSKSYAVKCLLHSHVQPSSRRQPHIREIALHQILSAHPGVVTLHRVIEDRDYTYIVMDYAPDHDLFTQILSNYRYVGDDALIKHVFLQLLDAVEYCHSLGIYHRDLKPENVLCFDDGYRVAITDFGLATTEKMSGELRTGSIFHMSPECQGGEFSPGGIYSPMFNDVWSLGIILLNLATGRNPWKTATPDDQTFQAYLRDPLGFFPSVLPISPELNNVLVRMLHVDWRERMTLSELRQAMDDVDRFYSDDVVFEGSTARCSWEVGLELDGDGCVDGVHTNAESGGLKSHWSEDSALREDAGVVSQPVMAEISLDPPRFTSETEMAHQSSVSSFSDHDFLDVAHSPPNSPGSSYSSPANSTRSTFRTLRLSKCVLAGDKPRQRAASRSSSGSSMVETAEEGDFRLSSPLMESPVEEQNTLYGSLAYRGRVETPNAWGNGPQSRSLSQVTDSGSDIHFTRPGVSSVDAFAWPTQTHSGTSVYESREFQGTKSTFISSFNVLSRPPDCLLSHKSPLTLADSWSSQNQNPKPIPSPAENWYDPFAPSSPSPHPVHPRTNRPKKTSHFAATRHWFLPGKLFASSVVS